MKAIYKPKGKAGEYGGLACNLYRGCGYGCTYCYAPAVIRMKKADFANSPAVRPGILEAIEKEASKYKGQEVFLCFTSDPYQAIDIKLQTTRKAIKILKSNDITIRILTKGGLLSTRDFDLLEPGRDWYGATLTFANDERSYDYEFLAAPPEKRIEALKQAHALGIRTWASLEPVISPAETLDIIRLTYSFVDVFKIGKWNYDPKAKEIDWAAFAKEVVVTLERLGKEYYIKEDLRAFL